MRILLVEDDERMTAALDTALRRHGYDVMHAASGALALEAFSYHLMLLDLGLPDGDGVNVCRAVRQLSNVPIIMLTARGDEQDRVAGLRAGADDYVVKPFSMKELEARIQAVLRRSRTALSGVQELGDLTIALVDRTVHRGGRPIALTPKELAVLARLASAPGTVVGRDQLLLEVWNDTGRSARRTLDVHITNLRAKLGLPNIVETIRGVGYRLTATPRHETSSSP